jgi:hypothetical protein
MPTSPRSVECRLINSRDDVGIVPYELQISYPDSIALRGETTPALRATPPKRGILSLLLCTFAVVSQPCVQSSSYSPLGRGAPAGAGWSHGFNKILIIGNKQICEIE